MHQRSHVAAISCFVVLIGVTALPAQSRSPALPSSKPADLERVTPMKPLLRLFGDPNMEAGTGWRLKRVAPTLEPRQICGTRVSRPNPTIDPKFGLRRGTASPFTMRIDQVLCR
jgi:hypothetical protein